MKPTINPITPKKNPTLKKEVIIERIPNTNVALPLIKPVLLEILALFIYSTSPSHSILRHPISRCIQVFHIFAEPIQANCKPFIL